MSPDFITDQVLLNEATSATVIQNGLVGVNQSAVHKWLYGGGIRSQYIASISRATKGVITTSEILASMDLSNGRNSNESVA